MVNDAEWYPIRIQWCCCHFPQSAGPTCKTSRHQTFLKDRGRKRESLLSRMCGKMRAHGKGWSQGQGRDFLQIWSGCKPQVCQHLKNRSFYSVLSFFIGKNFHSILFTLKVNKKLMWRAYLISEHIWFLFVIFTITLVLYHIE